jgi:hypothetical protein
MLISLDELSQMTEPSEDRSLLESIEEIDQKLDIRRCLEYALEKDKLEVFLQPLADCATGQWIAAEALVRLRDETGKIIGMWADYYGSSDITPTDPTEPTPTPSSNYVTIAASTSTIKIGGSYKTLTATVFDESGTDITDSYSDAIFNWTCSIEGADSTELDTVITWLDGTTFNKKKIKFSNDRSYLEKILEVKCEIIKDTETIETTMQFELIV